MSTDADFMNMSDDDFLNANHSAFITNTSADKDAEEESDDSSSVSEEEVNEQVEDDESTETVDSDTTDDVDSTEDLEETGETDDEAEETEEETDSEEESTEEDSKPLYTFKANGQDIEITNEDEAVKLMQMGTNYYEKMRDLKPHRKTLKTLEMNKITDEDINLMVELKQGNKDAISKLVREHGIDTHDLDTDEDSTYTPSDHTVSDTEVELDEVLSSIQDSTSFTDTMNVVNKQWDESSKRSLVANPQLIANLNAHVANGIYAKVSAEVTRQRMFGGLDGLSDLDAYNQVGDAMAKQGMFNADNAQPAQEVKAKPKGKAVDSERQDKKRKASPPKRTTPTPKKKPIVSFMDMSDEEFTKQFG